MVNKKPDTSEKNDEEINLNLVIVNKDRIFTGVEASAFAKVPIKWDFFSFKVNKKIRKLALRMALSSRLAGSSLRQGHERRQAETHSVDEIGRAHV